jgi:hypothetical protein
MCFLEDAGSGTFAQFSLNGVTHTVTEISDPGTIFGVSDAPGVWAAFWNAGSTSYLLKNEFTAPRSQRLWVLRTAS